MIQITTNAREILEKFDRHPEFIRTAVRNGLARSLLLVEDRVRKNTAVKARHGGGGLMGRLASTVTTGAGEIGIDGVIGFRKTRGFPYEMAQETGARAKPGKAMAMPVTLAAQRAGSPRNFGRELFIPGKMFGVGTHVLAEQVGKGKNKGNLVVHYVLLKSIPPRLKFRETVMDSTNVISEEVETAYRTGK